MPNTRKLVDRAKKVAFQKVGEKYVRMRGFTSLSTSKNPKEYTRQYVDELFETTDVVGISASIEFGFDQYTNDEVHTQMVDIIDNEKIGSDALVEILVVDFTKKSGSGFEATKRKWSVIPNTEGGSLDAYTYEGTLRVNSSLEKGTATSADEWLTATWAPAEVPAG